VICLLVFGAQVCGLCYIQKKNADFITSWIPQLQMSHVDSTYELSRTKILFLQKSILADFFRSGKASWNPNIQINVSIAEKERGNLLQAASVTLD